MPLTITPERIHDYMERLRPPSDDVLVEMERSAEERGFPYLGPQCGRLLYMIVQIASARRIFECGSGFGYSCYWMAKAIGNNSGGHIIGTEFDQANVDDGNSYLKRGGLDDVAEIRSGDALELLARESGPFDMIVCDINKVGYPRVPPLAYERLRPGGLLVTDNVLWSGRVTDDNPDENTRRILEYNDLVFKDPRWFSVIVPLRDGLAISIKQ